MELKQAIESRRSIRQYTDRQVPDEVIGELIEQSCMAPSARHRQPWYYVAVKSEEKMNVLKGIMEEASVWVKDELEATFANHPEVVREARAFIQSLGGAPVCLLAFLAKYYGEHTLSMVESVSASIQNLCLLAHDMGLGTCWMTGHIGVEQKIREAFGKERGQCIAVITLGYPQKQPKAPKRHKNVYEIV